MHRRSFLKTAVALGASSLAARALFGQSLARALPSDKAVFSNVKGADYFAATQKAVDLLGGMGRFVKPGSKVGMLVNAPSWWKRHGSHTATDVVLATAKMAKDAGASELVFLIKLAPDFWSRSPRSAANEALIASIKNPAGPFVEKEIPRGVSLKKANMIKELFDCDVFINLPIAKSHEGTFMTGCLKNIMGACKRDTNQFFHSGSGKKDYEDVVFLSQCIADVNLVRKPDLCIVDATEFLTTGGPAGPGEIRKEQRVLAGTDPVLLDARCAAFFDRRPEEILAVRMAAAHGIGSMDLKTADERLATLDA